MSFCGKEIFAFLSGTKFGLHTFDEITRCSVRFSNVDNLKRDGAQKGTTQRMYEYTEVQNYNDPDPVPTQFCDTKFLTENRLLETVSLSPVFHRKTNV